MTDKHVVLVPQEVPVHDWRGGMGHGKKGQMIVPTIRSEGESYPVNDRLTIKFLLGGVRIKVSDKRIAELNSLVARTNGKCYRENQDIPRESKYS